MNDVVGAHSVCRHRKQEFGVSGYGKGVSHLSLVDTLKTRDRRFKFKIAQVVLLKVVSESAENQSLTMNTCRRRQDGGIKLELAFEVNSNL
jgi:hypothetical protein